MLVEFGRAGKHVVRLKGGDPYVFGRGFEELQACAAAGLECSVVPGVTSAVSVPAAASVPVTQRGVTHAFTVVSGHLPPGHEKSLVDWGALARVGGTIVVVMGVRNVRAITAALVEAGLSGDTPAAVIQEGETDAQRVYFATAATLADVMEALGRARRFCIPWEPNPGSWQKSADARIRFPGSGGGGPVGGAHLPRPDAGSHPHRGGDGRAGAVPGLGLRAKPRGVGNGRRDRR